MNWNVCIICGEGGEGGEGGVGACGGGGGGGDLRCLADSHQNNGIKVYKIFLKAVGEFHELEALPVAVDFEGENMADLFLCNKAKWHKSCHLKFAQSKLTRVREQRGEKRKSSFTDDQRKSKRRVSCIPDKEACIFCSQVAGKLHQCSTMRLDNELRKMAMEMQDTMLLAKISSGDLVAIEANYHFNCLSSYKSQYRSLVRSKTGQKHLTILARILGESIC